MKPFSHTKKAQVSLETTALAVLSIIALLVMSTYVVRSINAYFKTTEDTIKDSIGEDLLASQRAADAGCRCEEIVEDCGAGDCEDTEERVHLSCYPQNCRSEAPWCRTNSRCCERDPLECQKDPCKNGERYIRITCGDQPETYECVRDEDCPIHCCNPIREDAEDLQKWDWCPTDDDPACPPDLTGTKDTRFVGDDVADCGAPPNDPQESCDAYCLPPFIPFKQDPEMTYGTKCVCPPGYLMTTNNEGELVCEFLYECRTRGIAYYQSDQNSTCLTNYGTQYAMNNYGCVWDNHYCRYNNIECCTLPPEVEIDTSGCTYTDWLAVGQGEENWFRTLLGIDLEIDGVEGEDALLAEGIDPRGITSCPANYIAVGIDYGHGATHGQVADTTNMIYRLECCPLRATRSGAGQNVRVSDCSWTSDYHGGLIADQGCAEFNGDHTYFVVALDAWDYMQGWSGYKGEAHKSKCCRVSVE